MSSPLARFTIRPANLTLNGPGDLIIGAMFKAQNPMLLRPGLIYEIVESLGELLIINKGDAAIGLNAKTPNSLHHWSQDTSDILSSSSSFVLTRQEAFPSKDLF